MDPVSEFIVAVLLVLTGLSVVGAIIDMFLGWRRADRAREEEDDWFSKFE